VYLNGSEAGIYNDEAKDPKRGEVVWKGSVRYAGLRKQDTALEDWM
jgi:hypothetical protein